jgi:hypothetical protein
MNILKYIINEDKTPIIFSEKLLHHDIIQTGIAAGYLILNYDIDANLFLVKCFGESASLNLSVTDQDELIISEYLNNNFYNINGLSEIV